LRVQGDRAICGGEVHRKMSGTHFVANKTLKNTPNEKIRSRKRAVQGGMPPKSPTKNSKQKKTQNQTPPPKISTSTTQKNKKKNRGGV